MEKSSTITGHSQNDGPSLFHHPIPNQPPALLLWHHSRPLPVSGKLPACSLFHQEPQEMSLRERWSLIKNKWMGCPRDRVNEEWEREGERSRSWCPEVEDREERRREGKTRYKIWTHYCVCFCTVMNQGNQNQLQRGVLANQNGNADQLADHLKPSNPLFTLSYNDQWAWSLQTQYKHTLEHNLLMRVCVCTEIAT